MPIQWVLIGALAANRYRSSPRMTGDVDLLLADAGRGLESLEEMLTEAGWNVRRADPAGELLRITHAEFGTADLLFAGTAYQRISIERAIRETVGDIDVPVLTPEDVVLHKLIAGRYQDLADIEAILETSPALDHDYLSVWLRTWELEDAWKEITGSG